jgi:pectate lyase
MKVNTSVLILLSLISFGFTDIFAQKLAFPGAEGSGNYTTGGRGGKVIYVSNLNDDGEGSLRAAINEKGTRTIVFKVSGTIFLQSFLDIRQGDLTIAGQTAPGDGICVAGYPVSINADNIIIRFMRFRLGDINKVTGDAMGAQNQKNIIIDHCSFSWATDENASFYRNENFTLQWCIISESLNNSVHFKGEHGYGGIWGGHVVSFHHNLFAHNTSRNPRFNGSRRSQTEIVDFRNNVIYNWGFNSIYGGEEGCYNIVGNYYKAGPATSSKCRNRIVNITTSMNYNYGKFFVSDNKTEESIAISDDNWNGGVDTRADIDSVRVLQPFDHVPIAKQTAQEAFESVIMHAGASLVRDSVDQRIIREVRTGTASFGTQYGGGGAGIIDSQKDVGGWPVLSSKTAPVDSDGDGMPDNWELKNKLNPSDPADGARCNLDADYTNLEVYLDNLVTTTYN